MSNIGVVRQASLLRRTRCAPRASAFARLDLEHFSMPSAQLLTNTHPAAIISQTLSGSVQRWA